MRINKFGFGKMILSQLNNAYFYKILSSELLKGFLDFYQTFFNHAFVKLSLWGHTQHSSVYCSIDEVLANWRFKRSVLE
jgi:hypothetical protein